ncbi:hypothetical protein CO665_27070 [Rhizobium anhuiense]|nr:hypothetical protein CO665_27070 [Rhizobium anhuiense]
MWSGTGLRAGCAATRLDKRSLPGSAETGAGRLRALGIERGRPDRAVAQGCGHQNALRMAMSSVFETRLKSWARASVV